MLMEKGFNQGDLAREDRAPTGPEEAKSATIRLLLADHHPIFRVGIRRALAVQPDVLIVAETSNAVDALAMAAPLAPDVVVASVDLPEAESAELVRLLRSAPSHPAVIFLSEDDGDDQLFEAVRVGAAALLSRLVAADELVETVRRVSRGECPIDEQVLQRPAVAERVLRLFGDLQHAAPRGTGKLPLSEREMEVLAGMAGGKSNKEIGRDLLISDQTVKNHISSVLRKLAVSDRTEAVVFAVRRGWIKLSDGGHPSGRELGSRRRSGRLAGRHFAA